jgi:hypothetical protein
LGVGSIYPCQTLFVSGSALTTSWTGINFSSASKVTPTAPLEVSGTISATNFVGNGSGLTGVTAGAAGVSGSIQFNSGGVLAGRSDIVVDSAGQVAIGTSNPSAALEVSGTLKQAGGTDAEVCDPDHYGQIRRNPTTGAFQICVNR